jgi:hypothetical protein
MGYTISGGGAYDQNAINNNLVNPYDILHTIVANPGVAPQPAFDQTTSGRYVITKAAIATIVLAAPVAGRDDGLSLQFLSNTAFAHVINFGGSLQDGAGHANSLTFPAQAGSMIELVAFNGKWNLVSATGAVVGA